MNNRQEKTKMQESQSMSGFTGVVREIVGHHADGLTSPSAGDGSTLMLGLGERNNFNDNGLETEMTSPNQMQTVHMRPSIDIISLDGTDKSQREKGSMPKHISAFKAASIESGCSTIRGSSPDQLKPFVPNKRSFEDEAKEANNNTSSKNETPINVIARVRPLIPNEVRHPVCIEVVDDSVVNGSKTQIVVRQSLNVKMTNQDQKIYSFEKVLDTDTAQSKVFADVEGSNLCNAFINGQNCTIFVYGPTSTGKTFTMQGNAEDIIHANTHQANHRSNLASANASPDQSHISNLDESLTDFEIKTFTPTKGKKQFSAHKKLGNILGSNRQPSNSFHAGIKGSGTKIEESPHHHHTVKPSIKKVAREMLAEVKDKGIIQRVLDNIFMKFSEKSDLQTNCEIKISFLEIYKEHVTDLLEGHTSHQQKRKHIKHNRNHSSSMGFQQEGSNIESERGEMSNSKRNKSRTFYGDQELEDIVKQKRSKMELDHQSPPFGGLETASNRKKDEKNQHRYSSFREPKKQYQVKENAIKGVYVTNLSEIVCETAEQAYHCLLDGLMKKRMSQTARNTSSSRSHTIFQIKMYMKAQDTNSLLLPQYQQMQDTDTKLVSKFCLIDLAGSERIIEAEKNAERIDEARFINKSLSALGNVVAALRTQARQKNHISKLDQSMNAGGMDSRRSSFHQPGDMKGGRSSRRVSGYEQRAPPMQHIPFRDSKLTHILKDCLGSNSFTHLIICLSPSYLCLAESISTLAFTKNAKAVKQNIVENVQFKSDLVQRNLAAQGMQRNGSHTQKHKPNTGNSLLSQMAGRDEDEAMLREIVEEFGGGQSLGGIGIKQLFQLTLAELKRFKESQQDQQKTIEEMKRAMEKDLTNNPRAIEIITHGVSEDISYRTNSFHSAGNKPQSQTPQGQNSSETALFGIKSQPQSQYGATAVYSQNTTNIRNNSLKSITEENYSASITSPQGAPSSAPNIPKRGLQHSSSHLEVGPEKLLMNTKKQASTTSIMTFAGYDNGRHDIFMRNRESQSNLNIFGNLKRSTNNLSRSHIENQNSCETQGGIVGEPKKEESTSYLETEPGEINDERTACSCAVGCSPRLTQQALIPAHNLRKLHETKDIQTMMSIFSKQLKQMLRKRILIESIRSNKMKPKIVSSHKRQKSWDNSYFKKVYENQKKADQDKTRSSRVLMGDQTRKSNDLNRDIRLVEPQVCISKDQEMRFSNSAQPYREADLFMHRQQKEVKYPQPAQDDHFTQVDKAGMRYFMPKLLKSSSCPNYQSEAQPETIDKQQSTDEVEEKKEVMPKTKTSQKKGFDTQTQELEISDIYSDDSMEMSQQRDDAQEKSIKDSNIYGQNFESYGSPEKLVGTNVNESYQLIYLNQGSGRSLKDQQLIDSAKQSPSIISNKMGYNKFEHSQGTNQNNLFENSRFSGTNSFNSQQCQLAQSQSQKVFNTRIGKGNSYGQKSNSQVRVIQLRNNSSTQKIGTVGAKKKLSNLKMPTSLMTMKKAESVPPKYTKEAKRESLISNEILVVEEVNDADLKPNVFQNMRKMGNPMVKSVNSNASKGQCMGPLIEDDKLVQHTGSLVEPQQSKTSTISSILHVQNTNTTFSNNQKAFQPKKQTKGTPSSQFQKKPYHLSNQNFTNKGSSKNKERTAPKTFITDLNKALPTASQTGGPKNNKLLGMLLDPRKSAVHKTPASNAARSNYKIPQQISSSNTVRKPISSFHSSQNPRSGVTKGMPMTQQQLGRVEVLDYKTAGQRGGQLLMNHSPPTRGTGGAMKAYDSNNVDRNSIAQYQRGSAPAKMPLRMQQLGQTQSMTNLIMKPKKPGFSATKISKPLAGANPDSYNQM